MCLVLLMMMMRLPPLFSLLRGWVCVWDVEVVGGGVVGGSGWVWVGMDRCICHNMAGCGWMWMGVGRFGWLAVGVYVIIWLGGGGCGWLWVDVSGCGWVS